MPPLDPVDPRYIGPFRLVGRLGAGGMGVVYAGLDDRDRRVAVKCVHRVLATDTDFRERFTREVKLVRRVRAACVPDFFGADTGAEVPWLATEYVPGPTLADFVRTRGPLSGQALAEFAHGVAEALTAIHAAGVVHRDLKPGNVILAPDGPKVLDFGIARATDGTALTRTGGLVGTPGWISPEQYRGAPATDRSDVFAWAGLVVHAATGRGPFGSGTSDVVVSRVLSEPPSLLGVPVHLHAVLHRALSKAPEARPTAAQLQQAVAGLPGTERHADAGSPNRTWAAVSVPLTDPREWIRGAPRKRSWARRHRTALTAVSGVLALALVVGLGVRALTGEDSSLPGEPSGPGGTTGGSAATGGTTSAAGAPDDAPEEYRDLYETGEVVVEPASQDEPVLVRRLEPSSDGGEPLDQLRIDFSEAVSGEFVDFRMTIDLEYLPDHGSLTVHSNEFLGLRAITPGQENLDFRTVGNTGLLAELTPDDPTETVRLTFSGGVAAVYFVPLETRARAQESLDYPGGFCVPRSMSGVSETREVETFPGRDYIGPLDTTLTNGAPLDNCAYTEDSEYQ
nr:serine/threonine-protein kinase [Nocardiopsis sp. SBT366]